MFKIPDGPFSKLVGAAAPTLKRALYLDLGEIKKAANFLVLVKLKVMDDNVCKLHIGPRAEALAHSEILFFLPLLPLTKDELAFIIGSS